MNIIVDTNIVFSAVLNTSGKIGQLLIVGSHFFNFYSVDLLRSEILTHKTKLERLSKLGSEQIDGNLNVIYQRIKFLSSTHISDEEINQAIELTKNIDENDSLFIALALHLDGMVWTGDKKLHEGLLAKGFNITITTEELYQLYKNAQN